MAAQPAYPSQWETHAVLKDGSTVEIRPIKSSDREALAEFHGRQSRESIYFRYFRYRPELTDRELEYFTNIDYRDRMAFVAVLGTKLVAVARYEKWKDRQEAEVAFFVDDDHHGLGLGTLMLEFLAAAGRDRELAGFTATVLPENYRMLAVFRSAGFEVDTRFEDGLIEVSIGIDVTEETSTAIADRQRQSTARSVARIVEPNRIAVIGASRTPGTVGHELVRNLAASLPDDGPTRLFPVNPNTDLINGIRTFATIADATAAIEAESDDGAADDAAAGGSEENGPRVIDLAVIAVRAELVPDIVTQCAEAGVNGLLVVSNGFSELDDVGADRERELVDVARTNGMRLIGPNAFGVVNTADHVRLRALFHPVPVAPGRVALASESGPLGSALLEQMRVAGIGASSFVGIGNRADVSVNDLLDYWSLDQNTDAVVLYVENFGNLRNFSSVAWRTSMTKPIIAIGPASADLAELLRGAGVIVVDQVSQLADQALLATSQPTARGNRVAVVANAASVARLAVEACRRHGLSVVVPSSVARSSRDGLVEGSVDGSVLIGNLDSVSLMPSGDPADYERTIVAAAVSGEVDLILVAVAPTAYLSVTDLAALLDRVNRSIDKPIAAIGLVEPELLQVDGLPLFTFPEEAAQVLGRHAAYGQWRNAQRTATTPTDPGPESEEISDEIERLLDDTDQRTLTMATPKLPDLLAMLAIPVAPYRLASGVDEVSAAAEDLGYPLVIKAGSLPNRSLGEFGGAAIDIHNRTALLGSHARMTANLGGTMVPTIVQRMIPSGTLLRLELVQDGSLGSLVTIGPGGSALDGAPPVTRRFWPFGRTAAGEMVDAAVEAGLLVAVEDQERAAIVDLIMALGAAGAASDQLNRVILNPVIVAGAQTAPSDVTVVLKRRRTDLLAGLRHLA
ncbi:MAG: GNAT family N-acetyltransferase [Actinomycetota bacterium]